MTANLTGQRLLGGLLALGAASLSLYTQTAAAQEPLQRGAYFAPLMSYVHTRDDRLDDGFGGLLGFGYRNGSYALEISGLYQDLESDSGPGVEVTGGVVNGLWFPLRRLPNLYGIASLGAVSVDDYPTVPRTLQDSEFKGFSLTRYGGGLGYLWPLNVGRYAFAIRSEAMYVSSRRDADVRPGGDINAPRIFNEVLLNLGLQLPFGFTPPPVPSAPPAPPVQVVQAVDSDGDGVNDASDQCPDTPRGEAVTAVGCPVPPPPPKCGDGVNGSVTSIEGCDVGDSIVLRGVNFDTDKAELSANARTLLDDVVADLKRFADVEVEISGHTDSRGAADYNQGLSERRAERVRRYLIDEGIASNRLTAVGYGLDRPIADNQTAAGQAENRRVELRITGGSAVRPTGPGASQPQAPKREAAPPVPPPAAEPEESESIGATEPPESPAPPSPASGSERLSPADDDTDDALNELFDF